MHFADRLIDRCRKANTRLVVGLDPHWNLIPASFKEDYAPDDVEGVVADFLSQVVEVCASYAAAFKPQIAFFEQFGVAGLRALDRVLQKLSEKDAIVIMDGKRNDIGSTAAAYARAFFGDQNQPGGFHSHALTINAYLGWDGVKPFLQKPDHGVFALVKTSNPSSGDFQDMVLENGRTLAEQVAITLAAWNKDTLGECGYGNAGAVVGATWPEHMKNLRDLMPQSILLVPGYGAQGGAEDAVRAAFNQDGLGALINSSRGILFPPDSDTGFQAVEAAASKARDHINQLAGA